ncbi:MAG: 16S rRNA (guanine(966)-N(2))-methyltransferase RsmD [Coriobacteriales bacterium]|jgi:16S rRNA (guanine966-N2)-methyltransferase
MRIVAGEFKGRVIEAPAGSGTRPTTDRVRESIFSSVYSRKPDLSSTDVLDAFAGSGGLGIEALSRGAMSCTFFERDVSARAVLEKNLSNLRLGHPRACVEGADVLIAAKNDMVHAPSGTFGLVLLDPPYALEPKEVLAFLGTLAGVGCLEEGCTIVYEHALANRDVLSLLVEKGDPFKLTGQKKYGKISVSYLKYVK